MKFKKYFKKPQGNFPYSSNREDLSRYDREPRNLKSPMNMTQVTTNFFS